LYSYSSSSPSSPSCRHPTREAPNATKRTPASCMLTYCMLTLRIINVHARPPGRGVAAVAGGRGPRRVRADSRRAHALSPQLSCVGKLPGAPIDISHAGFVPENTHATPAVPAYLRCAPLLHAARAAGT
jgi:hypothetical protein